MNIIDRYERTAEERNTMAKKKAEEIKDAVEEKAEEKAEVKEAIEEKAEAETDAEAAEEAAAMKTSTENKRKKKAERREAKAARKEANRIEEKKKRPSNLVLAILIFGVVLAMFAFVGAYNYLSKPASIEKYVEENGIADMYDDIMISEYTTMKVRAEDNTLKILFTVDEEAPEDELEQYTGDEGTEYLKEIGASFLTSIKPETQGFGGTVKVGVKQGDETINYVKMSYKEAKQFVKEAEEEAEAEAAEDVDTEDVDAEEVELDEDGTVVDDDTAETDDDSTESDNN